MATPRANGQVERYNRTILSAIIASIEDEAKWDKKIESVRWGINNTVNKATGKSAAELFFGYRPRHRNEAALLYDIELPSRDCNREKTREKAAQKIKENQEKARKRYNLRRAAPKLYKSGADVGVRRDAASNDGKSKKTLKKYKGPYEIKKVLDKDRYIVGDIKGAQRSQKPYEGVFPSEKLKQWENRDSSSDGRGSSDSEEESQRSVLQSTETKTFV